MRRHHIAETDFPGKAGLDRTDLDDHGSCELVRRNPLKGLTTLDANRKNRGVVQRIPNPLPVDVQTHLPCHLHIAVRPRSLGVWNRNRGARPWFER